MVRLHRQQAQHGGNRASSHDAVLGHRSAVVDAKPGGSLHGHLAHRALPAAVQGNAAGGSRLLDLQLSVQECIPSSHQHSIQSYVAIHGDIPSSLQHPVKNLCGTWRTVTWSPTCTVPVYCLSVNAKILAVTCWTVPGWMTKSAAHTHIQHHQQPGLCLQKGHASLVIGDNQLVGWLKYAHSGLQSTAQGFCPLGCTPRRRPCSGCSTP